MSRHMPIFIAGCKLPILAGKFDGKLVGGGQDLSQFDMIGKLEVEDRISPRCCLCFKPVSKR